MSHHDGPNLSLDDLELHLVVVHQERTRPVWYRVLRELHEELHEEPQVLIRDGQPVWCPDCGKPLLVRGHHLYKPSCPDCGRVELGDGRPAWEREADR